jgi:hypothetical protein
VDVAAGQSDSDVNTFGLTFNSIVVGVNHPWPGWNALHSFPLSASNRTIRPEDFCVQFCHTQEPLRAWFGARVERTHHML